MKRLWMLFALVATAACHAPTDPIKPGPPNDTRPWVLLPRDSIVKAP